MTRTSQDRVAATEVIRPAAVLGETTARRVLAGLSDDDVRAGGHWWARPGVWRRYAQPWGDAKTEPADALHVGTISCVYDSPQRYSVTLYRASISALGLELGWTAESICDDALRYAELTLTSCPRADLRPPPRPFRFPG